MADEKEERAAYAEEERFAKEEDVGALMRGMERIGRVSSISWIS
jgi:hypothetical protein